MFSKKTLAIKSSVAAAFFAIAGCGDRILQESEVKDTASAQSARGCGLGFTYDKIIGQCVSKFEIAGPFTPWVKQKCKLMAAQIKDKVEKEWSLAVCDNEWVWAREWGTQVYREARKTSLARIECQPGTEKIEKDADGQLLDLCRNGDDAYGPFPEWMIDICETQFKDDSCQYNRWSWNAARQIRRIGINGVKKPVPTAPKPTGGNPTVIKSGSQVKLKDVPYFCQRENEFGAARSCQATAAYMALRFYGKNGGFSNPDGVSRAFGISNLQETGQVAVALRKMGLSGTRFTTHGSETQIKNAIDDGNPVILQNCNTRAGHFIVIVGYDAHGWFVNDPFGLWNGSSFACYPGFQNRGEETGYIESEKCTSSTNRAASIKYSYDLVRRSASDGNVDGNYWITIAKP